MVITVNARLEGMRHELEQAAMDLYATPFQTFRYVTLPLAMPGIIAGALIAFTLSIDDFMILSSASSWPGLTPPRCRYIFTQW